MVCWSKTSCKSPSNSSSLSSSIIKDAFILRDAGLASVAYFYFDFRDTDKQSRYDLLSLVSQLPARSDPCCEMLFRLYVAHDNGEHKPSDDVLMRCLKEMLALLVQSPTYLNVDALDECPNTSGIPSTRARVIELVKELLGLCLPNLHLYITTRPEINIKASLGPLALHSLEALQDCLRASVRRTLNGLPESLDETYERILKQIKRPNRDPAHRLLQCLTVTIRPLRVEELAELLAYDFDSAEEGIPKEFLTSDRVATSGGDASHYHISLGLAHTLLAQACLGTLLSLGDEDGGSNSAERDDNHFTLASYAAQHWVAHARADKALSLVQGGMQRLFDPSKPHLAAFHGLVEHLLIRYPEHVNALDGGRGAALHAASAKNHVEVARLLLERGGDVNIRGDHPGVVRLLLEHGADVNVKDNEDATPLHLASSEGKTEVARLLLDHGADVDAKNKEYMTSLHMASSKQNTGGVVRLLLDHGANVDAEDMLGRSPFQIWPTHSVPGRVISRPALLPYVFAPLSLSTLRSPTPPKTSAAAERTRALILSDKLGRLVVGRGADDLPPVRRSPPSCLVSSEATRGRPGRSRWRRRSPRSAEKMGSTALYSTVLPVSGSAAVLSADSALGLFHGLTTFAQLWHIAGETVYVLCSSIGIQDSSATLRSLFDLNTDLFSSGVCKRIAGSCSTRRGTDINRTLDTLYCVHVPLSSPTLLFIDEAVHLSPPITIFPRTCSSAYQKHTKKDLLSHPLAARLHRCDSPSAVLTVLQDQVQEFEQSRSVDERLTKWLDPTVNVLYAFSAMLGEGVGLVFSPAKVIFAGAGVLLLAANDVREGQDALIDVFERVENFFNRLETYTEVPPTVAMTEIIVKIMVEVLGIFAISDLCPEKYLKKLARRRNSRTRSRGLIN
ncbi:hypothetical protein EDB87DRAFT_1834354 [Lactarius vividus]|nr:hypothetical protein EDB87DRAFT_1834354 [Lactarius vividus]